jgi:hypothetical protein
MLAVTRLVFLGGSEVAIVSIAAIVWAELRRFERHHQLVKNVQAVLNDADAPPTADTSLQRAA